jgi:hypothetical protein
MTCYLAVDIRNNLDEVASSGMQILCVAQGLLWKVRRMYGRMGLNGV